MGPDMSFILSRKDLSREYDKTRSNLDFILEQERICRRQAANPFLLFRILGRDSH